MEAAIDKEVSYEEYAAAHSDAELVKDSENALVIDAYIIQKRIQQMPHTARKQKIHLQDST